MLRRIDVRSLRIKSWQQVGEVLAQLVEPTVVAWVMTPYQQDAIKHLTQIDPSWPGAWDGATLFGIPVLTVPG